MKRRLYIGFIALASVTVGIALLVVLNLHQQVHQKQAELQDLNDSVVRLERSAAVLQKPAVMPATGFLAAAVELLKPPTEMPPDAQPFEFNGRTYYHTPLQQTPQLSINGA